MFDKAQDVMPTGSGRVGFCSRRPPTRWYQRVAALAGALLMTALAPPASAAGSPKVEPYAKTPHAEKIDVNLLRLQAEAQARHLPLRKAAESMALDSTAVGVQVEVVLNDFDPDIEAQCQRAGATVHYVSETYKRLSLSVDDPAVLHALAQIPSVHMIIPAYGATTQSGSIDGRASEALMADLARASMTVDGSGQTVGVLSDSFARTGPVRRQGVTQPEAGAAGVLRNSVPQDSGDLPPAVTIRRDDMGGSDEGAAMAELIHDIAPGADIAFHTAFGGQAVFADGIWDLCNAAGATVVVDDVIYFAEPMYQDGIIAQAAAACVAAGVPYFSAAGNQANRGLRQVFRDIAGPDDTAETPTGQDLHDWGGGDGFLDVTLPPASTMRIVLQWNQPFASVNPSAGAQIDLDLYVTAVPSAVGLVNPIARSNSLQGVTGVPRGDAFESVFVSNFSAQPMTIYIAVEHYDGSQDMIPQDATTPLEFRLVFFESNFRQTTIQGIPNGSSSVGGPTMYGHSVAPGVTSVAAVPWYDTPLFDPAFNPTTLTDPEDFSARGGAITVLFDANGAFAPRTTLEPDMAAVDGNNTTFFGLALNLDGFENEPDGVPNFFGTSAAAPNAAAVAALMRELDGTLTPADLHAALVATAIDITGDRAAAGWDDVTGVGLINADAALGFLAEIPNGIIHTPAGNVTIAPGDSVVFTASGSGAPEHLPLTFVWDFGGGAPNSTEKDPGAVVFATAGRYTVTLTVTDSVGMADPSPATVTVTVQTESALTRTEGGGGGGGGCALNPGAPFDLTLPLALGCLMAYLAWKRTRSSSVC